MLRGGLSKNSREPKAQSSDVAMLRGWLPKSRSSDVAGRIVKNSREPKLQSSDVAMLRQGLPKNQKS